MRTRARAPQRTEFRSNQPVATVPSARVGSTSLSTTLLNMQHSVGNQSVLHSLRALQARNESELEAQADSAAMSGNRPAQLSHPASGSMTEIGATLRDTSKGAELDPQIRKPMEARLGANLGQVRIHGGTPASAMNRDLNSRAFALGQSIYFGEGEYQPETDRGSRLLTHELAHTVQQQSGAKAILRQPKDTPQQQPAITAQQIIGLPQGSKVLLGRTMNEFFFGKVQSLAPDVAASLQVIDKQTATLTTVNDDLVEVKLDKNVTIPARDKQPEVTYQNVTIKLARASAGLFNFSVSGTPSDPSAPALAYTEQGLSARQDSGKFILSMGTEPHFRITPGGGPEGTVSIEAFAGAYAPALSFLGPLNLIGMTRLKDAPAGSAAQQQQVERIVKEVAAKRSSTGPRQDIAIGGGLISGARIDPLLTASWSYRFRVSPTTNNLLQIPVEAELLYGPSASVLGTVSSGVHVSLSDLKIPVNIRLITGFGGGEVFGSEPAGGGPSPQFRVAGPTLGGGVGLEKGWFRADIRYEHLFDVIHGSPDVNVLGFRLGAAY